MDEEPSPSSPVPTTSTDQKELSPDLDAQEIRNRLYRLRPQRAAAMQVLGPSRNANLKRVGDAPSMVVKRRRGVIIHDQVDSTTATTSTTLQEPQPEMDYNTINPLLTPETRQRLVQLIQLVASATRNQEEFITAMRRVSFTFTGSEDPAFIRRLCSSLSPSNEACTSGSSSASSSLQQNQDGGRSFSGQIQRLLSDGGAQHGSTMRERRGGSATSSVASQANINGSGRVLPLRSVSPAHPQANHCGVDDFLRPDKLDTLLRLGAPDKITQEEHSWNPHDRSLNIFVKDEDKFTFHRHPVAQSTDCIRGKIGFSSGFHVWQIEWPERQRGTHAVVGVATLSAPLHAVGYTALVGKTQDSYGWDITRRECHHDSKNTETWKYPEDSDSHFVVPDKFYCILDMDEGYMAFATDDTYYGVAFRNLRGKTLHPIVAAVWGHCEISMRYLGSLAREPFYPYFYLPVYQHTPPPAQSVKSKMRKLRQPTELNLLDPIEEQRYHSPGVPFSPFSDLAKIFSFYELHDDSQSSSSYSLFEAPPNWQTFEPSEEKTQLIAPSPIAPKETLFGPSLERIDDEKEAHLVPSDPCDPFQ